MRAIRNILSNYFMIFSLLFAQTKIANPSVDNMDNSIDRLPIEITTSEKAYIL